MQSIYYTKRKFLTMVIIRLSRGGSNKRPFYHFQATDSRNKRDGRYLEKLGYFNPLARGSEIRMNINLERVEYWQSVGAQLSDRVSALLKEYKALPKEKEVVETPKPAKKRTEAKKAESTEKQVKSEEAESAEKQVKSEENESAEKQVKSEETESAEKQVKSEENEVTDSGAS